MCGGDGTTCKDCAGVAFGRARRDECGVCDDDTSNNCVQDCNGRWGGTTKTDRCGVCSGQNSCLDCAGEVSGPNYKDNCGKCDSVKQNDCEEDCSGEWGGKKKADTCNVCGGDNSTCATTNVESGFELPGDQADYVVGSSQYNAALQAIAGALSLQLGRTVLVGEIEVMSMTGGGRRLAAALRRLRSNVQLGYRIKVDKNTDVSAAFGAALARSIATSLNVPASSLKMKPAVTLSYDCFVRAEPPSSCIEYLTS